MIPEDYEESKPESSSLFYLSSLLFDFLSGRDVLYELGPRGDINLIASLLKKYFRDLPEPLFPMSMFDDFIECTSKNSFVGLLSGLNSLDISQNNLFNVTDGNLDLVE